VVVTHQIRDAIYIATHQAVRRDGQVRIVRRDARTDAPAEFMVLQGGRIHFRGTARELQDSQEPYLKEFLYRTLPPW
jgi:phospholipid/cholesterol/gamma-HCH transport system ATP-binding protein